MLVLAGEGDVAGEEAVFEGVAAGVGLALGCTRAGGELGIPAIGFDLIIGCHSDLGGRLTDGARDLMVARRGKEIEGCFT